MSGVTTKKMLYNIELTERLFTEYGSFIRSVIDFNIKDGALAEDIYQDLFLFFVFKPLSKDVQNMKGFLYKVINDRIKDSLRATARYRAIVHRYAKYGEQVIETSPENKAIEIEETEKMFQLIAGCLPPAEALPITLRYRSNYNTSEIAVKMKIKPKSVTRYISIGLKKVRHIFIERQRGTP